MAPVAPHGCKLQMRVGVLCCQRHLQLCFAVEAGEVRLSTECCDRMAHMWWSVRPSPLGLYTTRHDSDDPATAERGKVQEHLRSGETWPGKPRCAQLIQGQRA